MCCRLFIFYATVSCRLFIFFALFEDEAFYQKTLMRQPQQSQQQGDKISLNRRGVRPEGKLNLPASHERQPQDLAYAKRGAISLHSRSQSRPESTREPQVRFLRDEEAISACAHAMEVHCS